MTRKTTGDQEASAHAKVKNAVGGMHMDHNEVKKAWKGVTNLINMGEWIGAFSRKKIKNTFKLLLLILSKKCS